MNRNEICCSFIIIINVLILLVNKPVFAFVEVLCNRIRVNSTIKTKLQGERDLDTKKNNKSIQVNTTTITIKLLLLSDVVVFARKCVKYRGKPRLNLKKKEKK